MIFKLFKIFASNLFSFGSFIEGFKKGPKGIIKNLLITFLVLYIITIFVLLYVSSMASTYKLLFKIGETSIMPLIAMITGFLVILFFGFTSVASNYYAGKGEDQFLAMPITPTQFFGAKFAVSFVTDAILAIMLYSIASIIYGYHERLLVNPLFWIGMLVSDLSFSLLGVALIYFFLIILLYFIPFLRKKGFLNGIASFFVIAVALVYSLGNSKLSSGLFDSQAMEEMLSPLVGNFQDLNGKIPVLSFFAGALKGNIFAILSLLAISALLIVVFIPLMAKLYIKTLDGFSNEKSKKLSASDSKKILTKDLHTQSIFRALYWRDVKTVLREPAFFANGPLMVFLLPVILIISFSFGFISASKGSLSEFQQEIINGIQGFNEEGLTKVKYLISVATAGIAVFTGNCSQIASSSFSREGKALYDLKAMPIDNNLIVKAKFWHAFTYIIIADLVMSLLLVVLNIVLGCPFLASEVIKILVLMALNVVSVSMLLIFIDMLLDTANPKLLWENPTAAFKQNMNSIIGTFLTIVVDAVAIILAIFALPKNDLGQIILAVIFAILSGPIGAKYFKYAAKKISLM